VTLLSLLLTMVLLAGCFGMSADFWGTVDMNASFTQLEYLGGETVPVVGLEAPPSETPLWKLRGTADYTLDNHFTVFDEGDVAAAVHCTGTAKYNVEAQIFKDIVLDLE